jgi:hypothetical protein
MKYINIWFCVDEKNIFFAVVCNFSAKLKQKHKQ